MSKNDAYGSYTRLPTSVMVRVYVPFGGADELRQVVREVGTMKRIVMWLMVAALMAALMAATAVPAFTDVGKRQRDCDEVAIPGFVTTPENRGDYGPSTASSAHEFNANDSSIGESIRGNACACNAGEGPPV